MSKIVILGSGAAPGVPSVCSGWGSCNPENKKNIRTRSDCYLEINGVKILIDTSPDIRLHMINANIKALDAVLYTHGHADHLHGIDDLRGINRISLASLNIYANSETSATIKQRFSYLISEPNQKINDYIRTPSLIMNTIEAHKEFYVKDLKIMPLKLTGHNVETSGYSFNDGEVVYIADFKHISSSSLEQIKVKPKILVIPLTTPYPHEFHAELSVVNSYIEQINPELAIINHMTTECDYDDINNKTLSNVIPAYDNMTIEF